MTDTALPVILCDLTQLLAGSINTSQMRRSFQSGTLFDRLDNAVSTVTFARVCAISNRNKLGFQVALAVN